MNRVNKKLIWFLLFIVIIVLLGIIMLIKKHTPSNAIIGGEVAPITRWATKIVSQYPTSQTTTACTGVALSDNYVLTVRHCIQYEGIFESTVTIYYSSGPENQPSQVKYKVDKLNIAPTGKGKIVLLHLSTPHKLESYPVLNLNYVPTRDEIGVIMGYGSRGPNSPNMENKLYQAEVTILGSYTKDGVDYIHAGYKTGISYYGDSGGPLLVNNKLVGVDVGSIPKGGEIYNNLSQDKAWLNSILGTK